MKNRKNQNKIVKFFKDFFSSKFNIYLVLLLIILGSISFFYVDNNKVVDYSSEDITVHFFHLPTCPHCTDQKPIYQQLKEERIDIQFFEHDASSQDGSKLFYQMATDAGLDTARLGVPTIFVNDHALVGLQTKENIINAIDFCINECQGEEYKTEVVQEIDSGFSNFELPFLGRVDLTKWSLPVLATILGLVDGMPTVWVFCEGPAPSSIVEGYPGA